MRTFLDEVTRIKDAELDDKKAISINIQEFIEDDPRKAESLLRVIMSPILASRKIPGLSELIRSDYAIVKAQSYIDEDYSTKVTIGIAVLPTMSFEEKEDLDTRILDVVVTAIKNAQLDYVINDVTVNTLQWRSKE